MATATGGRRGRDRRGWRAARAAVLVAAIGVAGCGSSDSKGDAAVTTVKQRATTTAVSTGGGPSSGSFGDYFPHAVGDTWVYKLSGTVTDTATEKVTAVDRQSDGGTVVTLSYHSDAHPNFDHQLDYLLRADGRLTILPQTVSFADGRQLKAGYSAVTYPSLDDLRAGRAASGTITEPLGSTSETISLPWTVQGAGTAQVTVPFGTFDTLVVKESLGPAASFGTTYYAKGVGGVKVESEGSLTELISFTRGKS